jgi:ligand-binding sensor domain-containing protein
MKNLFIGIIISIVYPNYIIAQQWTTYTTANGLAYNNVNVIIQDTAGVLWFGTWGGGVSRFDGTHWTTFNTSNSITNNLIGAIAIDSSGSYWFGTWGGGVSKFDGINWTTYNCNDGLADSNVSAIAIDKNGNKWFGGGHNGITRFNDTVWKIYTMADSLPYPEIGVRGIVVDKHNIKWFATDVGLLKYNDTSWVNYMNNGLITAQNISLDTMDNVWIGTLHSGTTLYNGTVFSTFTPSNSGLPEYWVTAIGVDLQNNKWFGTESYGPGIGKGVTKFDGINWTTYTTSDGMANNEVWSIYEDKQGNIWFGTTSGVSKFNPNVGVNEIAKESVNIFPNPANNSITFNTGMYSGFQLTIFNSIGQIVLQKQLINSITTLNIQYFKQGIYYYQLINDKGKEMRGKVIISK